MNDFLLLLEMILVNIIENGIYAFLFLKSQKRKPQYENRKYCLFVGITLFLAISTCLCNFLECSNILTQFILLVADLLVMLLLFQDSLPKKIFISVLPSCICMLAAKISFTLGGVIFSAPLGDFYPICSYKTFSTIMYLIVCLLLSLLFIQISNFDMYLTKPLCIMTYIIIALTIICTNFFLDVLIEAEEQSFPKDVWFRLQFLDVGFIVLLLFLFFLIQRIGTTYKNNLKLKENLYVEQLHQTQLEYAMQSMNNLRTWRHAYKNHLITLTSLAESDEKSKLLSYLTSLQDNLPEALYSISCGNTAMDAILTNKMALAKQYGIQFEHTLILTDVSSISDLEITAILGNLLDNALEACKKVMEKDTKTTPRILVEIKPFRDMLRILVENSSTGEYEFTPDNQLKTSKEDKELHGIGLKHVSAITDNLNGIIHIEPKSDSFSVNILIPITHKKE